MIFLFDKELNLIQIIKNEKIKENFQTITLNGLIEGGTSIIYDKNIENALYFGQKNEKNFYIYKIINQKKEKGFISLKGVHIFFDDLKGRIVRDIKPKEKTLSNIFAEILKETTWTVGRCTKEGVFSKNFYHKNALSCFNEMIKLSNAEFIPKVEFKDGKIIKKTVDILEKISNDYGKVFYYGDKLLNVVEETTTDVYTAFIGLGKGEQTEKGGHGRKIKFDSVSWLESKGDPIDKPLGIDYVEIKKATELFGYPNGSPKIGIVEFSNIEDKEILLKKTYEYAKENARPKLQMKATAFSKNVELGEVVAISRSDLNIKYKTRIFKIKRDFLNPKILDFEFGDKILLSIADRLKEQKEFEEKREEKINSFLDEFLKQTTNFYYNEDGYNYELKINNEYQLPAGYYSFDKPINENPAKVVYVGAGKILIADSKNESGTWNFRTAISPKGIVGDAILTNSITANKLSSDIGQNLDLSSNESINSTINSSIKNEISKVKVGARNLLSNSYFFDKSKWHTFGAKSIEYSKLNDIKDWQDCNSIKFVKRNTEVNSNILGFYLFDNLNLENKDYVLSFDCKNFSDFDLRFFLNEYTEKVKEVVKSKEQRRIVLKSKNIKKFFVEVEKFTQDPIFSIKKLKIEEGTIATTWVPALEDKENENKNLKKEILNLTTTNLDLLKKINDLNLNNIQLKEFINSSINQTKDSITFNFEKFKELYQNDKSVFQGKFDDISSYIRFDSDGMEMGKKDGEFKVRLSPKKQSFFMKEKEVAYFSNEELFITDARILRSIRIGNFAFVPRENGNLSFRKVEN